MNLPYGALQSLQVTSPSYGVYSTLVFRGLTVTYDIKFCEEIMFAQVKKGFLKNYGN